MYLLLVNFLTDTHDNCYFLQTLAHPRDVCSLHQIILVKEILLADTVILDLFDQWSDLIKTINRLDRNMTLSLYPPLDKVLRSFAVNPVLILHRVEGEGPHETAHDSQMRGALSRLTSRGPLRPPASPRSWCRMACSHRWRSRSTDWDWTPDLDLAIWQNITRNMIQCFLPFSSPSWWPPWRFPSSEGEPLLRDMFAADVSRFNVKFYRKLQRLLLTVPANFWNVLSKIEG